MLKYVFYIVVMKSYLPFGRHRLIIRDDREEMREYLKDKKESLVSDIVEYDFKNKVKKYYTLNNF